MKSNLTKHAFALFSMTTGGLLVFSTVLYMNQQEKPPTDAAQASTVEFKVEKKKPQKKQKPQKQERTPRRQPRAASAPKAPDLSSAISGVAIEFEGLGGIAIGGTSSDLLGSFDKQGPMTEGTLDTPPKLMSHGGELVYPEDARKKGIEGYVTLNLYVRGDGSVGTVKVLDSKPSRVFDEHAKAYVREFSFNPGVYAGETVDAWVKQTIRFRLQKS